MSARRQGTDTPTRSLAQRRNRLRLTVLGGEVISTHELPSAGSVVIGRGADCTIRVDEPTLSRRHARIRIGDKLSIADLGSSHGTIVGNRQLAANEETPLELDQAVTLGALTILVQQQATAVASRTLWGHGYFELRLAEECMRAQRSNQSFGLMRIRFGTTDSAVLDAASSALRDVDVVGTYAPGEWEVLLVDVTPEAANDVMDRVRRAAPAAKVAVATFPRDARDAWELASRAASRLDQPAAQSATYSPLLPIGPMKPLLAMIDRVALGDISVLIRGETGVGKELIAEHIHRQSRRSSEPLVRLNCAALPEQLLESELFGYERGAFTGAVAAKPGLLELADGGTVFLDEIGELPMATQAKLLRVLEQREILRVGGLKPKPINVRFVTATHVDLDAAVKARTFREDLYYRIAGLVLDVPALRDRLDELDSLSARFVARAAADQQRAVPAITPAAMELLRAYRWPGNVRELRNVLERATLLCDGVIDVEHLPGDRMTRPAAAAVITPASAERHDLHHVAEQSAALERKAIEDALSKTGGNQTEAAKLLGVSRRTLTNKLNLYGLARPRKR